MHGFPNHDVDAPVTSVRVQTDSAGFLHEVTGSDSVADLLRSVRRAQPTVAIAVEGATEFQNARVVAAPGPDSTIELADAEHLSGGDVVLWFEMHDVRFAITGVLNSDGGTTLLCVPWRVYTMDRRGVTRVRLPPGRGEFTWYTLSPDSAEVVRAPIYDLTPDGVGVLSVRGEPELPSGVFPARVVVDGVSVACLAENRSTPGADGPKGVCLRTDSVRRGLSELYIHERLPQLCRRYDLPSPELRSLMEDSGYLSLRSSHAAFETWKRLQPEDIPSYDRVYRARDGALLGHISVSRIYTSTWILHQLACVGGHAESGEARIATYVMMAAAPLVHDGSRAKVLAYYDQSNRWHQLLFHRFISWAGDARAATVCGFDRFERDAPFAPFALPPGYHLRRAAAEDLLTACALVRSAIPELTATALDIHPATLHYPAADAAGRGRCVLVLSTDEGMVGVALCDTGPRDFSLFNIVNMAQIYLRVGFPVAAEGQRALVSAVRQYYRARGVDNPMVVAPAGTLLHECEPGTRWAENMGCIAIAGSAIKLWENYCLFHLGQRWRRSRLRKAEDSVE